jgi:hypothetical protein
MAYAENLDRFWTVLTGDQQIPPVPTDARGYGGLKFQDDWTQLVYIVNVDNIGNVTGVYIYQGDKNQNGIVLLDLLNGTRELKKDVPKIVDLNQEGKITGTLSIGGISKDDLQGQLKGKSLSDLHNLMVDGTIYIGINTKDFPSGEIRGDSFVGIDRLFPDFSDIQWD